MPVRPQCRRAAAGPPCRAEKAGPPRGQVAVEQPGAPAVAAKIEPGPTQPRRQLWLQAFVWPYVSHELACGELTRGFWNRSRKRLAALVLGDLVFFHRFTDDVFLEVERLRREGNRAGSIEGSRCGQRAKHSNGLA